MGPNGNSREAAIHTLLMPLQMTPSMRPSLAAEMVARPLYLSSFSRISFIVVSVHSLYLESGVEGSGNKMLRTTSEPNTMACHHDQSMSKMQCSVTCGLESGQI